MSGTYLVQEYLELAAAYDAGTLKEPPQRGERHMPEPVEHMSSFGPQRDSRFSAEPNYSFSKCLRETQEKVFISKECSKSQPGNNSQGCVYNIKGTFGKTGAWKSESNIARARCTVFGTDLRDSQDMRELKARSIGGTGRSVNL